MYSKLNAIVTSNALYWLEQYIRSVNCIKTNETPFALVDIHSFIPLVVRMFVRSSVHLFIY